MADVPSDLPHAPRTRDLRTHGTGGRKVREVVPDKNRKKRKKKRKPHLTPSAVKKRHRVRKTRSRYREKLYHEEPMLVGVEKQTYGGDLLGRQEHWVDPNHPARLISGKRCWDEVHPDFPYNGGPFRKYEMRSPWTDVQGTCSVNDGPGGVTRWYDGGFVPLSFGPFQLSDYDIDQAGWHGAYSGDYGDPSAYGAEAFDRFKPKLQGNDLLDALYETKDLPGSIETSRRASKDFHEAWKSLGGHDFWFKPDHVAEHFLNHVFGWVPFLNDIKDTYRTYSTLDSGLKQLARDNGRWIKRSGTVRKEEETLDSFTDNELHGPYAWPALDGHLYRLVENPVTGINQFGITTFTRQTLKKVWFRGCFRYYIPGLEYELLDPSQRNLNFVDARGGYQYNHTINVARRFGFSLSPTFFWKILPWSWLADWGSNVGHVISNLSDNFYNQQLVARYAYLMEHDVIRSINDSKIFLRDGSTSHCIWYQEIDTKCRIEANPFGFSLNDEDLSLVQKAILLSLGVTGQHPHFP